MKKVLILEDGSIYEGKGFGSDNSSVGKMVFHTGMCGYQEIISDPSYYGKILMMTYPAVGNVGINRDDFESMDPQLFGLVVKEYNDYYSNFRGDMSLDEYMKLKGISGIYDIDTRSITRKLREQGSMTVAIVNADEDIEKYKHEIANFKEASDYVKEISTTKTYTVPNRNGIKIIILDLGVKYGVIRELSDLGCEVMVMPYNTSKEEILALRPDGIVVSNGAGRIFDENEIVENIRGIIGKVPVLALGLGNSLVGKAMGLEIERLSFGHHSSSFPVVKIAENKIEFTAQNNDYVIKRESIENNVKEIYRALNDDSVQGILAEAVKVMGVSFSPEASPGADDTKYIFKEFVEMVGGVK